MATTLESLASYNFKGPLIEQQKDYRKYRNNILLSYNIEIETDTSLKEILNFSILNLLTQIKFLKIGHQLLLYGKIRSYPYNTIFSESCSNTLNRDLVLLIHFATEANKGMPRLINILCSRYYS